ncbi:hypothetical protein ACROYT_G018218 [Oculina patagonica]
MKDKIVVIYTNVEEAMGTKQESTASSSFVTKLEKKKILGIKWSPCEDQLCFEVKIKFSPRRKITALQTNNTATEIPPQQLTKRIILSQINGVFDPLGLAVPFTVRAKSLMRHLWGSDQKLDWDDPIPEENRENWITFFKDLQDMGQIRFMRCMKPLDAIEKPILIVFSDMHLKKHMPPCHHGDMSYITMFSSLYVFVFISHGISRVFVFFLDNQRPVSVHLRVF